MSKWNNLCENLCEKIVPKHAKMAKIGKNVEFIYLMFLESYNISGG
jgi:hypothetical protein